jgi:hypothetical protein
MAGLGLRWKHDDRPQRYGWAPGEYIHGRCVGQLCRELEDSSFIGAKRAIICADCAYAMPDEVPAPVKEKLDRKGLLLELQAALVDMDTMIHQGKDADESWTIFRSHTLKYAAKRREAAAILKQLLDES